MYENIIAHIPTHTIICHSWRGRTEGKWGISKVPDIVSDLFSLCPILEASEIFFIVFRSLAYVLDLVYVAG